MKVYFEKGITVINTEDPQGGCKNKTGYNGVIYKAHLNKYQAVIHINKKKYHLGHFENIHNAAAIYNEAKKHVANGTFHEWHQTLYGKTKCKRTRRDVK